MYLYGLIYLFYLIYIYCIMYIIPLYNTHKFWVQGKLSGNFSVHVPLILTHIQLALILKS